MGTKMAPSSAIIFMGKLEKLIIQSSPYKPLSWLRFIYDVDMKWTESEENKGNNKITELRTILQRGSQNS
jgi:hypothetical protein